LPERNPHQQALSHVDVFANIATGTDVWVEVLVQSPTDSPWFVIQVKLMRNQIVA
jgi:hypothetical protein